MADTLELAAQEPIPQELLDLAPLHLHNFRADRYKGETIAVVMADLAGDDQEILLRVYRQMMALLTILSAQTTAKVTSNALRTFLSAGDFDTMRTDLRALGRATFAGDEPVVAIAKAIHDIRGGALTALLMRLGTITEATLTKKELRTLFILARDHCKIIRSTIVDLDPARRQRDQVPQSHHVRMLVDTWEKSTHGPAENPDSITIHVDCRYDGAVTECCLESAAIDRVFYNLLFNATRHNAGPVVDLLIFDIPQNPGDNVRFVVRNTVTPEDGRRLRKLAGVEEGASEDLGALFAPGVSSTGSGLGLAIVADFVKQAFGLESEEKARQKGYFGARLADETFIVWFHWPAARDGLGDTPSLEANETSAKIA